jgi:conjugative relaxase-like TrwC/TraI family protein
VPDRPVSGSLGGRVVLSLGKLAHGQQAYYVDAVARGAEEYYTAGREAPGQWIGAASHRLGLEGEVDPEALAHLLAHVDPSGQYRLTGAHSVPTVAAYDVTFCAPKSVSLLFALGDPEVSNEVRNATDAAIGAALPVLEAAACQVRRGRGGHTVLDGDGFVAAAFRHRTSRAGDPHLHTHVLLTNIAHCPDDDKWSALDGRPIYSWLAPVGCLYEAHLRWELSCRLGVEWTSVRNGIADVAGIPRPVLREFSTRRKEIEAHLEEHGFDSAKAAQLATYATRRPKDTSADPEGLSLSWWDRAEALGFDTEALDATLGQVGLQRPPHPESPAAKQLYEALARPDGLTASRSTFGQREVIKAICDALPAGGSVDSVLALVDGFLRSPHVLPVCLDDRSAVITRNDGKSIAARTDEHRWTTPEMLATEGRLLAGAQARRNTDIAVATGTSIERAIANHETLGAEQAAMVRQICSSGDGVEIVEGGAGAGKTYALAVARHAWETSGHQVLGCALAAQAAKQLQAGAGIPSQTIDRLLAGIERQTTALDATTVLVVDEAAMVGTRKLARLLDHAQQAGSKVVLVGDPCQLPEIEAGGAFRGLQGRLGASVLTDNRRQTSAWERDTLAGLRAGDAGRAFDDYLDHERVHRFPTGAEVREQLVEAWASARFDGHEVLMVAARHAEVDDLNRRARHLRRDQCEIGEDEIVLRGRPFARGDDVLALRNDYKLGVLNGTRATVEQIDTTRQELVLVGSDDQQLTVPFAYAESGYLTHGYATTVHKAQGATVDRCFILADETMTREHVYTALSRGRHGNDLYIVGDDQRTEDRHAAEVHRDALDAVRGIFGRSATKRLATDQQQPQLAPIDQLRAERDAIRNQIGDGPPDFSHDYRWLSDDLAKEKHYLAGAQWRLDHAQKDLDAFGPIRRRSRPSERRDIEQRVERFTADVDRHTRRVESLEGQLDQLTPAVVKRSRWEREHRPHLNRLRVIDRSIESERRLALDLEHSLDRGVERGLGLGL